MNIQIILQQPLLCDGTEFLIISQDSPSASALSLAQSNLLAEDRQRYRRNRSYLGAVADLADSGAAERIHDVRAGLQRVLQVFITNAANIFLLSTGDNTSLQEQVNVATISSRSWHGPH